MTTLQDAARKSFEAWKKTGSCFYLSRNNAPGSDLDGYQDAYTQGQWVAWQAALAQQPVCHGCGIPAGDVHMSTCKSGKWPSRVSNGDTAAPAQAQPVAQPLTDDPLQGAVDWLLQADGEYFCVATVQRTLRIGYNRAKRLADVAKERAIEAAHGIEKAMGE